MFRVFEDKEPTTPVTHLRLRQVGDTVLLEAVNEDGMQVPAGNLLTINSQGQITRHAYVSESLGFDLDDDRRIRVRR